MSLQVNDLAPDFEADTAEGRIRFHDWVGDSWVALFAHPMDFTPVGATELGHIARIKPEFARRHTKCGCGPCLLNASTGCLCRLSRGLICRRANAMGRRSQRVSYMRPKGTSHHAAPWRLLPRLRSARMTPVPAETVNGLPDESASEARQPNEHSRPKLACYWRQDADGRLVCQWYVEGTTQRAVPALLASDETLAA